MRSSPEMAWLARKVPEAKLSEVERLCDLAKTVAGLNVAHCNGDLSPRQETRALNARREAEGIVNQWVGCRLTAQGDPRGAAFKVQVPDGSYDSWGGEGWCVPE